MDDPSGARLRRLARACRAIVVGRAALPVCRPMSRCARSCCGSSRTRSIGRVSRSLPRTSVISLVALRARAACPSVRAGVSPARKGGVRDRGERADPRPRVSPASAPPESHTPDVCACGPPLVSLPGEGPVLRSEGRSAVPVVLTGTVALSGARDGFTWWPRRGVAFCSCCGAGDEGAE